MTSSSPSTDVGDALISRLRNIGARVCFGVPGGQTIPLYGAARRSGFSHVLMRDERNAACAADAYARVTGRIGVCDATVGPGATNLISGLAEAYASGVPVLAIVADVKTEREHLRHRGVASQAMEQRALMETVSKQVVRVHSSDSLGSAFDSAIRVAVTGRAGPVTLEIPEDVFTAAAELDETGENFQAGTWPRYATDPSAESVALAVEALAGAERPIILAGGGAMSSLYRDEITALAEMHNIPVVTSINGKGVIDEYHALSRGVVGVFGSVAASVALQKADVVLILGSKFAQFNSFLWRLPSPAQHLIHVDSDGAELGRAMPVSQSICADAGRTALHIREAMGSIARCQNWQVDASEIPDQPGTKEDDDRVAPEAVIELISEMADEQTVMVSDASLASGWAASRYRVRGSGRKYLAPRGLAGIGWAGGAAIGAAVALQEEHPEAGHVVSISGDGATSYWIGEVETAVRLQLPIIFVILNNAGFGWIMQGEQMLGIQPRSTFGSVDFSAMGRAMGTAAFRAETIEEASEALQSAWQIKGPVIIEIASSEMASPSVDFGALDPSAASAYGAYGMG
ncbi:thiamine pyrophosphate-binding protein [Parasphingorhabdus sp.]|uniref:thiamine pyrophosphate-binding protein n=1 Tax=Parasphingorhabdus sp. TaxID=2709688 RepID=UPI003A90DB12